MNPTRLALYYAAYFAVIGILMPFWPIWLEGKGLDAVEIGFILASAPFIRAIGSPLIAQVADRRGLRRPIIIMLTASATISFAIFNYIDDFWPIVIVTILFFMLFSASQPLAESLTMHVVRNEGANYGRMRLWGSVTFILAAIGGGYILEGRSVNIIFYLSLFGLWILFVTCIFLPKFRFPADADKGYPILKLLKIKPFVWMLIAAALIQSSHAVVYSFSTIHWKSIGFSESLIGILWAEGVVAEIILFQYSSLVLKRISPTMLIVIAAAAGIIRWSIMGYTDFLPALIFAQVLHGLTFGAAHLGAIHYISETIPPNLSATAQSLLSAVVMGLAIGLTTMISGVLYSSVGSLAYFPMAGMAFISVIVGLVLYFKCKKPSQYV